jgi:DNA-binding SARP family transcriptional activator
LNKRYDEAMAFLHLFGVPSWRVGRRTTAFAQDKPSGLLLYLAAHPKGVFRHELCELLWGQAKSARSSLRQALQRLEQHPLYPHLERDKQHLS